MKVTKFEGTAEEFKAAAHLFSDSQPTEQNDSLVKKPSDVPSIEPQEAIRRMLTRLPISDGQMAVYKALSTGRLEHNDFLRRTERKAGTMAGVLGALGRRINNTEEIHQAGLPGNTKAILKWEKEGGKVYYSLTPHAIEALKAEGVI